MNNYTHFLIPLLFIFPNVQPGTITKELHLDPHQTFVIDKEVPQPKATYSPGKLTLFKNSNNDDNWEVIIKVLQISFDCGRAYPISYDPEVELSEKTVRYNHADQFIEEYVESSKGIRQNFIIHEAPGAATEEIRVNLQVGGDLIALQTDDDKIQFLALTDGKFNSILSYSDLKAWDSHGKPLTSRMELTGQKLDLVVSSKDAIYPITIDPISSSSYTAIDGNIDYLLFGTSVASAGDVNGDGYSDIIVGAPNLSNGQGGEGGVYIFHGSSNGINTSAAIRLESNQASSNFGGSVSSAGDVNNDGYSDIVIGSSYWDNGNANEGAVWVYYGSSSGISSSDYDRLEINHSGAYLGVSVAGAGDVNGDGYSDIIAGANLYDNGQSDEGIAVIYHGSASGISSSYNTLLEINQASAMFGSAVAGAGDVNGDGYSDVIVGAPKYDGSATDEGVVNIYHGGASGIVSSAALSIVRGQSYSNLGISVSSAGDVNGDGYSDIIFGANKYDGGQTDEGVAFIHHGSASGVSSSLAASMETNQAYAEFAISVACAGDVNGDGYSDVIVGSIYQDNGQTDEGIANVYLGSSSGIVTSAFATLEKDQSNSEYGTSVASAGDINGDGYSDVIVGAPRYNGGQPGEGVIFIYEGESSSFSSSPNYEYSGSADYYRESAKWVSMAGDLNGDGFDDFTSADEKGSAAVYYGSASGIGSLSDLYYISNWDLLKVGAAGDVNGDGYKDVVVGYKEYKSSTNNWGRVMIFKGSSSGLSCCSPNISILGEQLSADFGHSIASAGDVNGDGYADIIVGSPKYDNGESDEGAAYIYYGSSSGTITSGRQIIEVDQAGAWFGYSVSTAGDVNGDRYSDVIIGAPYYDNGSTDEGAAFVFYGSENGIVTDSYTQIEVNQANGFFGGSVSCAGDVNADGYSDVIVGAYSYDAGSTDEGIANVYHGSSSGLVTSAAVSLECNTAGAYFGYSVSSAGDVNGDGYSDVIVGAHKYNGYGAAFVYHGSTSGITSSADVLTSQTTASFEAATCVSSAGDINGDGYSDVIIGEPLYTKYHAGTYYTSSGRLLVWYGNGKTSMKNNLRLYNTNLSSIISHTNVDEAQIGLGLYSKSFLGRTKARLTWEIMGEGEPFSSASPITNSTGFSGKQSTFSDLGVSGSELKALGDKAGHDNKIRVRVEYDKTQSLTGQIYGPWKYPSVNMTGLAGPGVPLPVELIDFYAEVIDYEEPEVKLSWKTTSEINNDYFVVEKSQDLHHWISVGKLSAAGNSNKTLNYDLTDHSAYLGTTYYRLGQYDFDGTFSYLKMCAAHLNTSSQGQALKLILFPNPASDVVYVQFQDRQSRPVRVFDSVGQELVVRSNTTGDGIQLDVSTLPNGIYFIKTAKDTDAQTLVIIR